ncbi:MAG: hypothetical protein IT581_15605 [Verrucomicrobiales bacterium]|nr:hypothetical protein [Verrucomicrobiales bacterium]
MATLPTQSKSFPAGNRWGVLNGSADTELSFGRLVHAAVTAGHDRGWRQSIASDMAAQWELLWKTSALRAAVSQQNTPCGHWRPPLARLFPTKRLLQMDPSERRALSYHLGITLAVAWARKALRIPWLLHLDVYREQLDVNFQPGDSRPDLVGRHADGSWVVFEAKGRSSAPNKYAEMRAKDQSRRVVDIGGGVPSGCIAFFSYFSVDRSAVGRRKPKVVHLRAIDPEPGGGSEDEISLPLLTTDRFFQIYYAPWQKLVANSNLILQEGPFTWRRLEDLDFRVGMLTRVALALEQGHFADVPGIVEGLSASNGLSEQFPDWAGDGLVIEPGESWQRPQATES